QGLRRASPYVIDNHVEALFSCLARKGGPERIPRLVELNRNVRAQFNKPLERLAVASRADYALGAEQHRHLQGELPGYPGRAQNQHRLARHNFRALSKG